MVYGVRTARGLRGCWWPPTTSPTVRSGLELAFDWDIVEDSDHYPFIVGRHSDADVSYRACTTNTIAPATTSNW